MTNKPDIKFFGVPYVRVTAFQDPETMKFLPIIEFIAEDKLADKVEVNSYSADLKFDDYADAISIGLNVASYLNMVTVQFEDIQEDEFEIVFWDPDKQEHYVKVEELAVIENYPEEELDIPESVHVHYGNEEIH